MAIYANVYMTDEISNVLYGDDYACRSVRRVFGGCGGAFHRGLLDVRGDPGQCDAVQFVCI